MNRLMHIDNGADALNYIFGEGAHAARPAAEMPKVILLDLNMPKVNGREVLARLKADPLTRQISVVILTSFKEDPDIKECYRPGANSYVVKPVEFDNFAEAINGLGLYWVLLNQPAP